MRCSSILLTAASLVASACAKNIVVTVGGNTTADPTAVFTPNNIQAVQGDVILFNFTQGNHTATESTFASPCTPAHFTNATINGFDSAFRSAGNYTAITQLTYVVPDNTTTIYFYDWNTCAKGGVGAININESSWETFDGFVRNAIRLNGTDGGSSSSSNTTTAKSTRTSSVPQPTSAAQQAFVHGISALVPVLALLAAISF